MNDSFYLFAYGTLKAPDATVGILDGCERVDVGVVRGTLYDVGDYPALLLGGDTQVPGVIWRIPADRLEALDAYEGTEDGLFRRAGVHVGDYPCWVYVAGPELGDRLVPEARVEPGPREVG